VLVFFFLGFCISVSLVLVREGTLLRDDIFAEDEVDRDCVAFSELMPLEIVACLSPVGDSDPPGVVEFSWNPIE